MSIWYTSTLSAAIKRRVSSIIHSFYLDVEPTAASAIFVCGSGRSGTTWLAELLNHANDFRFVAEPFNCEQVPACRHFAPRQYVRPSDDSHQYLEVAQAIFSGRIRNPWIDSCNRRMIARRRLVKDVRSTMMLKWIRKHFPEMPIIFLLRHPCAVAASRVKQGWRTNLRDVYFRQDELMADHLAPFAEEIVRADSPFERHTIDWCVENLVPLRQLSKGDVYLAFYENLCVNPHVELQRLFSFLNRPFKESILRQLSKPSISSRGKEQVSNILTGDNIALDWQKHVSAEEILASKRITYAFGLDQIYDIRSMPDVVMAERLLG